MKEAPVFRFFFTPLEWIFLVLLALGVCGYVAYPAAKEYVIKIVCPDLQETLKRTQEELLRTKNALDQATKQITSDSEKIKELNKIVEQTQNDLSKYQNQVYDWQDYCRKMLKYLDTKNISIEDKDRPEIPLYFQMEFGRSK